MHCMHEFVHKNIILGGLSVVRRSIPDSYTWSVGLSAVILAIRYGRPIMGPITAMTVNMFSILIFLLMKDPLNYINIIGIIS